MKGKYNSLTDQVLHFDVASWADGDAGDQASPQGVFSLVASVTEEDAREMLTNFVLSYGDESSMEEHAQVVANLTGKSFLVVEDEQGFVKVTVFTDAGEASDEFDRLTTAFEEWSLAAFEEWAERVARHV